ncbi:MAG: hypothetical protein CVU90_09505 [Firmicutes bacterium HGW-Firmicutes-15]|nr:MAG: hypothetical protein CVU90_09505 [Firmicutes bacterium HGW-Firmicutes-15]
MLSYDVILIIAAAISIIYYYHIASSSKKYFQMTIQLFLMGIILWISPNLSNYFNYDPLKIAGFILFVCGIGILTIESFFHGLRGKK